MTATVVTTATQESDKSPPVAKSPELPPDEEIFILAWLELIEETDPVLIEDVLTKCRNNLKDRRYYLKLSAEEVPKLLVASC
jgi:hypothetical protein